MLMLKAFIGPSKGRYASYDKRVEKNIIKEGSPNDLGAASDIKTHSVIS